MGILPSICNISKASLQIPEPNIPNVLQGKTGNSLALHTRVNTLPTSNSN